MGHSVSTGGDLIGDSGFESAPAPETYELFIGGGEPVEKQPGDIVFPIQEMVVRFPNDPILINGTPYSLNIDTEATTRAVNSVRDNGLSAQPGRYNLRMVKVDYTDGLHPKIQGDEDKEDKPIHDYRTNTLNLSVPREVTDSRLSDDDIAIKATTALNRELTQGLLEAKKHRGFVYRSKVRAWGGVAVLAAAGEAIAAESSPEKSDLLLRASGGALIGASIGVIIFAAKSIVDIHFRKIKNIRDEVASKKAYKSAKKEIAEYPETLDEELDFLKNPAITLERE